MKKPDHPEKSPEQAPECVDDAGGEPRPGDPAPDQPSPPEPFQPWECPCCHEKNDGAFDICWNCQTTRNEE